MSNTQLHTSSRAKNGLVHFLSRACIAVAGMVIVLDLLTISFNRGFSPLEHTISEFVLMDYGWIERTGLFLLGSVMFAPGYCLVPAPGRQDRSPVPCGGVDPRVVGIPFSGSRVMSRQVVEIASRRFLSS